MASGLVPATILHAVLGSAIPGGCFGDQSTESRSALQLFSIHRTSVFVVRLTHGRRMGRAGGALPPLDFEINSKKILFFQFRGVKNKFHHFWHPPGKIFGKIPYWPRWKKSLRRPWMNL